METPLSSVSRFQFRSYSICDQAEIFWKIEKFSTFMNDRKIVFTCGNLEYNLLYRCKESRCYIILTSNCLENVSGKLSFEAGLKGANEELFLAKKSNVNITSDFRHLVLEFSETKAKETIDLPNDTLTVYCNVKTEISKSCRNVMANIPTGSDTATLSEDLEKIYDDPRYSDVLLNLGKESIPAHKAVLASRSKVFQVMFDKDMKEKQTNAVDIKEMPYATLKDMLKYIYTNKLPDLSTEAAINLYAAADRYELQELKLRCRECILRCVSSDNVCDVATLAHLHCDEELNVAVKRVMSDSVKAVVQTDKWKKYVKQNSDFFLDLLETALNRESK